MENQNNNPEIPQEDAWLDDILGEQALPQELGPDEQAIAEAGLVHPEDVELEAILKETLEDSLEAEPSAQEPQVEMPEDQDATRMFTPVQSQEPEEGFPEEAAEVICSVDEAEPQQEPADENVAEEEEAPLPKRRPKMKQGYGLFGIPHLLVTCVWLAIVLAIGVYLG